MKYLFILAATLLVSLSAQASYKAIARNALGQSYTATGSTRDKAEAKALSRCQSNSHANWGKTCRISSGS